MYCGVHVRAAAAEQPRARVCCTRAAAGAVNAHRGDDRGALTPPAAFHPCHPHAPTVHHPARLTRCPFRRSVRTRARSWGNLELVAGDVLVLIVFCLYKQITSIVFAPDFPGWLAPLHFSPLRLGEFVSFAATVTGTWVATSLLCGDYDASYTDMNRALQRVSRTWLISMPIMASQLVLVTAAENHSLVLDDNFTLHLPLAASGLGEPFVTAAGILAIMYVWRTYYAGFMDWSPFLSYDWSRTDSEGHADAWRDAVVGMVVMSLVTLTIMLAVDTVAK